MDFDKHPLLGKKIIKQQTLDPSQVYEEDIFKTLHPCVIVNSTDTVGCSIRGKWLIIVDNDNIIIRVRKF